MAKAIFYADSAHRLDPNLSIARISRAQMRATGSLVVRFGAAG